jgi:hypothetical protein
MTDPAGMPANCDPKPNSMVPTALAVVFVHTEYVALLAPNAPSTAFAVVAHVVFVVAATTEARALRVATQITLSGPRWFQPPGFPVEPQPPPRWRCRSDLLDRCCLSILWVL